MKTLDQILIEYEKMSKDPASAGYSLFQCAAYDGVPKNVERLIKYYNEKETLSTELSFIAPETKETILHIAIKNHEVFSLCCKAIEQCDKTLFATLIQQQDMDEDSVFHQIAEFGRAESLKILMPYLQRNVEHAVIDDLLKQENRYGETAEYIAEHGTESNTIKALQERNIIDEIDIANALDNSAEIQTIFFEQISSKMSGLSM